MIYYDPLSFIGYTPIEQLIIDTQKNVLKMAIITTLYGIAIIIEIILLIPRKIKNEIWEKKTGIK